MSFIWHLEDVNQKHLKSGLKLRLSDIDKQEWLANVHGNILCLNYRIFKEEFGREQYLTLLEPNLRRTLTKFRSGFHNLPITNRRYDEIDDRNVCPLCQSDVGDEFHYLLVCPSFEYHRNSFLPPYYNRHPNVLKFKELLTSNNKRILIKVTKLVRIIMYVFRAD